MKPAVYDAIGRPGKHIDASIKVRRWDLGLAYGALGAAVGFLPFAHWGLGWYDTLRALSLDPAFYSTIDNPAWLSDWSTLAAGVSVALLAGASLGYAGLIPRSNQWVVSGPRLLEGKDALREARRRSGSKKDQDADLYGMWIHPDLYMSKKTLARSTLIAGSVGSGKTQILLALLQQIFAHRSAKLFLYDVKGDFSAKFPQATIVSCFDSRSRVWWVARDVRTSTQASAFADSLIPEDSGSGKFWTQAARQILLGVVRSLQNEKPEVWTWTDLAERVSMRAQEMAPILDKSYRKAYGLISNTEGQTAFNVIATLNGYTKVIDDLARAWPDYERFDKKGNRRLFSITDWAMDDYQGPTKVIVQSGPDAGLAAAYISAMVNVAVPAIISPQLADNEGGRFLGFVFDEMSSIGKINFAPLVDKGRSKGVVFVAGYQDLAQLREIYGDNQVKALQGMVGTHIICQIQMGETREDLSKLLGTQKVARMDNTDDARLSNEGQPVVYPNQLTDMLGFRKTKKPPHFEIRAIVQQGGDLLLLNFPGQPLPDKRIGQIAATWTTKPAGYERPRQDLTGDAVLAGKQLGESLDQDELDRLFQ
ncbi:MAG: DUF853 family protein [Rubrivivax sp.]|nr:MAG: DUF853 family protein [Rubrivivax sp.]